MPSTSAQQAKFMTACAKGWDAESCPPMAVARKFHEADKKEGKYLCKEGCEHGAKKESTALDDAGTVVAPPLGAMARLKLVRQLAGVKADIAAAGAGPMAALKRLRLVATANQVRAQLGAAVRTPAPAETAPEVLPAAVPPEVLVIEPAVTVAEEPADDTAFGLQSRGKKTRERINAQVVSITDQVLAGRDPKTLSADDIALLKQYSGKGGLTDNSQYEYYTPTPLAEGTWDILKANGFQNGNVLEPSTGAGVFSATKPAGAVITGTEIDPVAATVNAVLHPEDSILNQSFEKLAMSAPDNFFDAVVGNVPFGNARGAPAGDDPAYKHEKQIERYFITRVIDKTRPGGLITLVVPAGVVANATGPWKRFRAEISRKAEFLGAHKLPSKTFAAQGTDVVTDIIVLRKHSADFLDKVGSLPADLLESTNVLWGEFISGQYWKGEGVRFIHGQYIPADKTKIRSMEQVIPEEGSTPESLKRKLAVQFESRIDWAALESAEPVIVYYAAGDRRIVNGKEMEFDGQHWAEVQYVAPAGTLDAAKYGADNMEALQAMASDPESMLSLSSDQAFRIYKDFPNLLSAQLKMAVEFAQSQPLDAFREQAYRGSLIGSSVTRYIARSNTGDDDEGDRTHLRNMVEGEFSKFGHPRSAKGFYLEGEPARYFGAYLNAVDENGRVSDALADGMAGALGYDPKNPSSVAEYLVRAKDDGLLTFESFKETYEGPGVNSMADVADFEGLAISPDGMITTMAAYCSGEVYVKAGALAAAMEGETDSRIKAKYQAMIDLMMTKVKRTGIEDITFGLRDRWIKARYKLDFLKQEGYALRYVVQGEKESDTGETFIGNVDGTDSDDQNGIWVIERYTRAKSDFPGQLEHYMAGRSIGHNIRDKGNESASERIARFREQINGLEERFGHYMQTHEDFAEIERTYNLTFNNYVAPERDDSDLGLMGISGQVKPHPFQNQGVRYLSEEGTGILGDDVGLGKAQPLDAKILTPGGWRLMGDIQIGDMVIGGDGMPTRVTGVFPQGEKEIFEVKFSDGAKTRCCDDHLWFTETEKDRVGQRNARRTGNGRSYPGSVKALCEIREGLVYQSQKNHKIPMVRPVDVQDADLQIPPYVLGVLLGDGCLTSGTARFTPGDDAIAERVAQILADQMPSVFVTKINQSNDDKAATYSIPADGSSGGNCITNALKAFGLHGKKSEEKFVPEIYLHGSIRQRIDILRGLMDTDGYVSKDGITVQFSSVSEALASAVVSLVQSLGGSAWTSTKTPTYQHNGVKLEGQLCYTVSLRMPGDINPFDLKRKADRVVPKSKYQPVRYFVEVRSVGMALAQCIRVESPDHLYVTDDYIVTHNTTQAVAFSLYDRQMGRSKKHAIIVPKAVLANWYMESKKIIGNHNDVMFVGFEPKRGKDGVILTEPVLDENGKPKPNKFTGEIEMQDLLVEDSPAEVFQKMHSIPQSSVGLVIMTYEKYATIPMREESRLKYAEKWAEKSMMSRADAEKIGKSYQEAKSELKAEGDFANDGTKKKQELPYFEDMGFDRIIVDEFHCFPYGTQIMTIDGPMEIGDIVERRIDTKILSCDTATGELSYRDITGWMPKAMLTRMVRVDHANGHFLCTENHLIWTVEESYVEAGKLNQSHTLQVLRGEVHSEVSNPGVLQQGVRTEVDSLWNEGAADLPAMRDGVLCGSDQAGSEKEEVLQHVVLGAVAKLDSGNEGCRQQGGREAQGRPAWSVSGLFGTDESQQSDVQSGNGSEGIFLNEGEGSAFERGERASFDPADSALHCARGWVGDGVRNQHEGCSAPIRPSFKSLQGGHCESGPEDCGGAGRLLSQLAEIEGVGCQKGSHLVGSRVARVSVLEPADFDRYGLGSPFAQVVYDIEVEGNHNFFAEGVLAHNCFKNSFSMGADAQKLAYLPNPAPSQRARDMAMKCAWLREKYDGKGVIGLTATPVANSPIEIFNMLSLVIDSAEFERLGIYTPDDFVRQFGMIQDVEKVRVSGEVVNVEGLAGFKNLNALRALFHRYALMRNAASVDPNGDVLRLPDSVEMMTEATMSSAQEIRYANLRSEAKDAGNPQKIKSGEARPMFAVIRDMDRVTTDMDLYNREMTFLFKQADQSKVDALIAALPATISYKMLDEESGEKVTVELSKATDYTLSGDTLTYVAPENYEDAIVGLFPRVSLDYASHPLTPKYAKLLANMQSELDSRGKQIVFTEEKSQHGKLARLIVQNLPVSADQVAIINATTADGEKLQQISDAYNRGDVRIIIANKKAEVGVNLQKGTSAIHHMTLPWNPASIQQRNGRGVRQGNTVSQVRVYYYQATGSFDEYRLDLLKNKGNWIASLMDKGNTNDKAENSAAMGALEQAALLADNREEFLKMVADQKAAKAAEETEKRNQAAKVKLNQLGSLTMRLGTFDADKAKARADAEENIVKAQASYDKMVAEEGEEGENTKRRKYQLSAAKTRASKLDGEWEKKKTDMESQRRQAASYLKGMAAKGTLPFDAAVIEAPGDCIVTTTRLVVRKGGAYQVKVPRRTWGTDIVRVGSVDLATRLIGIVPLVGSVRGGEYRADDFMLDAVEVNMTADELETMALLNKEHSYAGIKALGRAFFDKHRAALMVAGYALIRNVDGDLSQAYGRAENELIVFPDESDAALKADMTAIFAAREMGLNNTANGRPVNLASYNFQSFAEAIYGADWKDVLGASLKRASMADLTAKASEILNGLAAAEPQSTVEELNLLAGSVLAGFKGYNRKDLYALGTQALNDWMTAGEFINMGDVKLAFNQVATAFRAQIAEKISRKKIEDEKAKIEATRNDPNFKEIPADLAEAFKKIGVDAFYNTEEVATAGKYGSKTWPAFSMIFLKDRAGKNGRVYPVKEILKARFKATFCSSVVRGAAKYGDSTWVIPASTNPQQIYDVLS